MMQRVKDPVISQIGKLLETDETCVPSGTMNTEALFLELSQRGIRLLVVGDSLKYVAKRGALTEELLRALSDRKTELIMAIKARQTLQGDILGSDYPLSYAQRRLWVACQFDGIAKAYCVPIVLDIDGKLEVVRMIAAIQAIIFRHETLRTAYRFVNGEPRQVVLQNIVLDVEH